jgi:hypothetical protein
VRQKFLGEEGDEAGSRWGGWRRGRKWSRRREVRQKGGEVGGEG